jgi:uncharacterized SAM-binding protein YcdF (DUF218 family)
LSLSALPVALVVPPINLLGSCLLGCLIIPFRLRVGRGLLVACLLGLLLLSLPIVSTSLLVSLEGHLPEAVPIDAPPGAIVVLSGDVAHDAEILEVGALTLERERAAAALHRRTGLPILVTGGAIGGGSETLAGLMAASLRDDFQVPVRWRENAARDTTENAALSAAILRGQGIRSIYLVTHAWHMKRALQAFAGTGITVIAAPVRLDRMPRLQFDDFVPRTSAWLDSYYALHEWIGYVAAAILPRRAPLHGAR